MSNLKDVQYSIVNICTEGYRLKEMAEDDTSPIPEEVQVLIDELNDKIEELDNSVTYHIYHDIRTPSMEDDDHHGMETFFR